MYKFIAIKGVEGARTGYLVPRLYQLVWSKDVLKIFGLRYIIFRLKGWTIWWVENEISYLNAISRLEELKKTRLFTYKVL
ncbi:hypothetical protein [uncultured Eubacterium sp.]|uniref:hypothetical protein n=1 Tax=uncultured Eubacterium sp. TaxID=165185 RepID=UPI0025F63095|nr:hypothetical protein [uncultured Eubacterium sp.]